VEVQSGPVQHANITKAAVASVIAKIPTSLAAAFHLAVSSGSSGLASVVCNQCAARGCLTQQQQVSSRECDTGCYAVGATTSTIHDPAVQCSSSRRSNSSS
jgi:hypothetical protein